ncbi:MAG: alpha/beta hydrolase [Saprospiraceae bacterium]|nr:alpha/beta hydrolase [Lewinella sp.]
MQRTVLFTLYLLLGHVAFTQPANINYEDMAIQSSRHWLDIDYVGDRIIGHRLDIHLPPEGKAPFPVIIAIYGSAWFSNSSKSNTFSDGLGQQLLENGFAVVSINHRSSRDALFPAQIQDVKAAIRFIRANGPKFMLDTSFIGITGWSSGGHLSAMAGTTSGIASYELDGQVVDLEGKLGAFTETDSHVDAVVDWFGPTDFLIMDECGSSFSHDAAQSPESSLVGGPIQQNKVLCALANPITYVRKDNPPFLIFHGDKDPLVPHCQSEKLYEQMKIAGTEAKLVIVAEGKHGPKVMIDPYYKQMIDFFKAQRK